MHPLFFKPTQHYLSITQKKNARLNLAFFQLDYQDSNLEKQDQNLLCYHYTIVQSFTGTTRSDFDDAKILLFFYLQTFLLFFFFFFYSRHTFQLKKHNTNRFHNLFFVQKIKPSIFVPCFII